VGQKNTLFKKQTGEVIDNKGLATKNKPEQTEKQSGEVVENMFLWKKRTANEAADVVDYKGWLKNEPKTNRRPSLGFLACFQPLDHFPKVSAESKSANRFRGLRSPQAMCVI